MNVSDYLGIPYHFRNENGGICCWGLYCLVMKNERGIELEDIPVNTPSLKEAAAGFAIFLATSKDRKMIEKDKPQDFDLVLISKDGANKKPHHCGVYYKGKVLHANGQGTTGQVWYDELNKFNNFKIRFFRYEN